MPLVWADLFGTNDKFDRVTPGCYDQMKTRPQYRKIVDNHKRDLPSVMWQVSVGRKFSSVASSTFS